MMPLDASFAQRLARRAALLRRLRAFFDQRGFVEVETPLLDDEIIPELHIEPFAVPPQSCGEPAGPQQGPQQPGWLQASPEMAMKRLLVEGCQAIYQVTRSFRAGERGRLHHPEFTIVEWYRVGDDLWAGMALLEALASVMFETHEIARTTFHDAFMRWVGIAPHDASCAELAAAAQRCLVSLPTDMPENDRDAWLNVLLALVVEPHLGANGPEILYDYPASQAALARTAKRDALVANDVASNRDVLVAERFELYYRGVELANGYHELTDASALRTRLVDVNRQRIAAGRRTLPLPERLLRMMESPGLPNCSGCALGFDRLAMLALGEDAIRPS